MSLWPRAMQRALPHAIQVRPPLTFDGERERCLSQCCSEVDAPDQAATGTVMVDPVAQPHWPAPHPPALLCASDWSAESGGPKG